MTALGHAFWLFGLSGAGKTTLAHYLHQQLRSHYASPWLMLDGDRMRSGLCKGLGYSEVGRTENLRRASEVARIGIESGINVIASFMTPMETHRQLVEQTIGPAHVSFVYVAASLEVCRMRDVKGLYAKAQQGSLSHMSGVDLIFDRPSKYDLVIDTEHRTVDESGADLFAFTVERLRRLPKP